MYGITIAVQNNDRVVTAGRINAGKESMHGLSEKDWQTIQLGGTVYIESSRGSTAIIEISFGDAVWQHKGLYSNYPKFDLFSDYAEYQVALLAWADTSEIISQNYYPRH